MNSRLWLHNKQLQSAAVLRLRVPGSDIKRGITVTSPRMKRTGFSLPRNTWRKHPKIKTLMRSKWGQPLWRVTQERAGMSTNLRWLLCKSDQQHDNFMQTLSPLSYWLLAWNNGACHIWSALLDNPALFYFYLKLWCNFHPNVLFF